MVTSFETFLLSFTIFFFLSSPCVKSHNPHLKASKESFTIDIIHRDSMKSPLFDSTKTHFQRTHDALLRSQKRMKYLFQKNESTVHDDLELILLGHGHGEYLMQFSLGNPMYTTYVLIDTGGGLSWVQCQPSISSYDQGYLPFLHTNINNGLTPVHCNDNTCTGIVTDSVTRQDIDYDNCQCKYLIIYFDGSATMGHVFRASLRLQTITGDFVGFQRFIFGCSREVSHGFEYNVMSSGYAGFGMQPGSFISQISDQIGGIFGHCLVPLWGHHTYSKLKFGQSAAIFGPDVIYTRIYPRMEYPYFYWISLQAISVGNRRMPFNIGEIGNMGVDTGTVLNRLPFAFYSEFEVEVQAELDLLYEPTPDPYEILNVCYLHNSVEDMRGPIITLHLNGGDLVLSVENTYVKVADGVVRLNFIGDRMALLGVMGQTNFMVTYYLQNLQMSFKKMNCAI